MKEPEQKPSTTLESTESPEEVEEPLKPQPSEESKDIPITTISTTEKEVVQLMEMPDDLPKEDVEEQAVSSVETIPVSFPVQKVLQHTDDEKFTLLPEKPSDVSTPSDIPAPVGAASVEIPLESAPVQTEEIAPTKETVEVQIQPSLPVDSQEVIDITVGHDTTKHEVSQVVIDRKAPDSKEVSTLLLDREGQPLAFPEIVIEVQHPTEEEVTVQQLPVVEESIEVIPSTSDESPKEISTIEFGTILVDELPSFVVDAEAPQDDHEHISELLIAPEEAPLDQPLKLEVLELSPTEAQELPVEPLSAPTTKEQITDESPGDIPTSITIVATELPQDVFSAPELEETFPDKQPEITYGITPSDAHELPVDTLQAPSTEEISPDVKPDDVTVTVASEAQQLPQDVLQTTEEEHVEPQDSAVVNSIIVIPHVATKLPHVDLLVTSREDQTLLDEPEEISVSERKEASELPQDSLTVPEQRETLVEEKPDTTTDLQQEESVELPMEHLESVSKEEQMTQEQPGDLPLRDSAAAMQLSQDLLEIAQQDETFPEHYPGVITIKDKPLIAAEDKAPEMFEVPATEEQVAEAKPEDIPQTSSVEADVILDDALRASVTDEISTIDQPEDILDIGSHEATKLPQEQMTAPEEKQIYPEERPSITPSEQLPAEATVLPVEVLSTTSKEEQQLDEKPDDIDGVFQEEASPLEQNILLTPEKQETYPEEKVHIKSVVILPFEVEKIPGESLFAPEKEEQRIRDQPDVLPVTEEKEARELPQDTLIAPETQEISPESKPEITSTGVIPEEAVELPLDELRAPSKEEHVIEDMPQVTTSKIIPGEATEIQEEALNAPYKQEQLIDDRPEQLPETESTKAIKLPQDSLRAPGQEHKIPQDQPEVITTEVSPWSADELPEDVVDIVTIMQNDLKEMPMAPVEVTDLSIPVQHEVVETTEVHVAPDAEIPHEITTYELGEILQEEIPDEQEPQDEKPLSDIPTVREVVVSPEQLSPVETSFEMLPDYTPAISEVTYVPLKQEDEDTHERSTITLAQERPDEELPEISFKLHKPKPEEFETVVEVKLKPQEESAAIGIDIPEDVVPIHRTISPQRDYPEEKTVTETVNITRDIVEDKEIPARGRSEVIIAPDEDDQPQRPRDTTEVVFDVETPSKTPVTITETVTIVDTEEFPDEEQPEEERSITEVAIFHEKPTNTTEIEFDVKKPRRKPETITETITVVETVEKEMPQEDQPEEDRSITEVAIQHERPSGTTEIEFDVKEPKQQPQTVSETTTVIETVEEEFLQEEQPDEERSITEVAIQHERPRDTTEVEFDVHEPKRRPETITETVTVVETVEEEYPQRELPDEEERSITEVAIQHDRPRDTTEVVLDVEQPDKKPETLTETITVVETVEEEFEQVPQDDERPSARTEFVIAPDKPQRDTVGVEFFTRRPTDDKKRVTMTIDTERPEEDLPEISFQVRKPGPEESEVTIGRKPEEPKKVSAIEFAPRFTKELVDQTVPLGGTTELTVEVTAAPKPDVQWYRNGVEIFPSDTKMIELEPIDDETFRSTLFIKDITEDDDTEFSVIITNPKGSVTSYAEITVEGKEMCMAHSNFISNFSNTSTFFGKFVCQK